MPAVVEFRGFAALPAAGPSGRLALWIPSGGSPDQVAQWFASALALDASPERFAASCLGSGSPPWQPLGHSRAWSEPLPGLAGSYHYRLGLGGRGRTAVGLQCWRYYPQGLGWQRRCGPMPLRAFIRHFAGRRTACLAGGQPRGRFSLRSGEPPGAPAPAG
jgi:hypothetical protein